MRLTIRGAGCSASVEQTISMDVTTRREGAAACVESNASSAANTFFAIARAIYLASHKNQSETISQGELDLARRIGREDTAESTGDVYEILGHLEIHPVQSVVGLRFQDDGVALAYLKAAR